MKANSTVMPNPQPRDLSELGYDLLKRASLFKHELFHLDTKLNWLSISNARHHCAGHSKGEYGDY